MNDYILGCSYDALRGFRFFFNDHIIFDTAGAISSHLNYILTPYLRIGENSVRVVGGSMALTTELEGTEIPDFDITLRQIHFWGDENNIIEKFALVQAEDSSSIEEVDGQKTLTFTFENKSEYDFSSRFETFAICNNSAEEFSDYFKKMQTVTKELHSALYDGDINFIIGKSAIKLQDDSMRGYGDIDVVTSLYRTELTTISGLRPLIKIQTPEQFIFAPSCGGRIWRVGIMPNAQFASSMQKAISLLPAALPWLESELFSSAYGPDRSSSFIPSYLAFIDDECYIVR